MLVQVRSQEDVEAVEKPAERENVQYQHTDYDTALAGSNEEEASPVPQQPFAREGVKIGRNDPCPCGSGKKYKQCHGALT